MRQGARGLAAVAVLAAAMPAHAAPATYDAMLVGEFSSTCLADRASFAGSKAAAEAGGWTAVAADADPEFQAVLAFSDQAAQSVRQNNGTIEFGTYAKLLAGVPHYLILSDALIGYGPQRQNVVGCYLYNFAADATIDPASIDALAGATPTETTLDADVSSWQWNRPAALPETLDVFLTFVPEASHYREQYGFSGLVLQLNTMTPSPTELPGG